MGICCCAPLAPYGPIELPDKIIRIDHTTRAEAFALAARSFAGTSASDPEGTTDWAAGPHLAGKWDDPRRQKLFTWLQEINFMMLLDKRGGFALGARKPDGSLGAVVLVGNEVWGYPSDAITFFRDIVPSIWKVGMRPLNELGDAKKGVRARLQSMDQIEAVRKRKMAGPHLYVGVMAVDPNAQGMGFCGFLMRFLNSLADKLKLPLYLEASGPKLEAIYKRFGYETVEQFEVSCPNDPDRSAPHAGENAMIRPAATS